ncbi:hypothetical protein Tco_0770476 [Tanacetum coccineum]|uniref:Helitron helicase-like domain-containing protein n=1 Tax=Tanacetum coccineum TaxID=301880 RepID=A0ABQ4ZCL2_9ASTR
MSPGNNHAVRPSLSNILHTFVMIHSNTIINRDENVQSFCCLKLLDIRIPDTSPSHKRLTKKGRKLAALASSGTGVSCHSLGAPSYECRSCNATMWYEERITRETGIQTQHSHYAANKIRVYNGMFCFTSFGAMIDHSINVGSGLYTFRINGQNYHRIGSLLPKEGTQPRIVHLPRHFEWKGIGVIHILLSTSSCAERTSSRQYNIPTVSEVAALIINDFGDGEPTRDIVVNKKDIEPKRILELHPSCMALQYPLLFPYGKDGYHDNILYHTNTGKRKTTRDNVTMKEYYAYIIQYKKDQRTTLLRGVRLFQ